MGSRSEYVPVGRLLVSTRQRPARLGWLLLTRGRPLLGVRGPARRSPARRVREVARAAGIALGYARRRRGGGRVGLLEPGDVAATVSGHKVFDLRASRVIRLAPTVSSEEFLEQVGRAVAASSCPLAPAVGSQDEARRRYEEEFLAGPPLLSLDAGLTRLDFYLDLLSLIVRSRPAESVRVGDYAAQLAAAARGQVHAYAAAAGPDAGPDAEPSKTATAEVDAFITDVLSRLADAADRRVELVLSHGDLHGGNLCLVDGSPRLIDWQLSGSRTVSYDLYVLLFRALSRRPRDDAVDIARQASARFAQRLRADAAPVDVDGWLRTAEENRLLFYLEYLAPKRLGAPAIGSAGRLARLRDAVGTFRRFEWQAGTSVGGTTPPPPALPAGTRRRSGLAKRTGALPAAGDAGGPHQPGRGDRRVGR